MVNSTTNDVSFALVHALASRRVCRAGHIGWSPSFIHLYNHTLETSYLSKNRNVDRFST